VEEEIPEDIKPLVTTTANEKMKNLRAIEKNYSLKCNSIVEFRCV
jgi:hypothetical protein